MFLLYLTFLNNFYCSYCIIFSRAFTWLLQICSFCQVCCTAFTGISHYFYISVLWFQIELHIYSDLWSIYDYFSLLEVMFVWFSIKFQRFFKFFYGCFEILRAFVFFFSWFCSNLSNLKIDGLKWFQASS